VQSLLPLGIPVCAVKMCKACCRLASLCVRLGGNERTAHAGWSQVIVIGSTRICRSIRTEG